MNQKKQDQKELFQMQNPFMQQIQNIATDSFINKLEHPHLEEYVYPSTAKPDSLELLLEGQITKFIKHLQKNEFKKAQNMLHPEGVYYYSLGRISPNKFDLETLKNRKGRLSGAYEMTDEFNLMEIDSMVNGLYWLDSLRYNYTEKSPTWYDEYGAVGYGFSGNHSCDHIYYDVFVYTPDSIHVHVAYIHHNSDEIDHRDILMIEFFEDKNGEWRIYAIGNLEWTP